MISVFRRFSKILLYSLAILAGLVGYSDTARAQNSLAFTPGSLSFTFTIGTAAPVSQTISVTSSGVSLPINATVTTATGGAWLAVTPLTSSTPAALTVTVNPVGLAAGTYNGAVNLMSPGSGAAPLSVPVSLVVTAAPALTISQNNLQFYYQVGQANPAQAIVNIGSSSTALNFTATGATSSGNWLVLAQTAGTTPTALIIGANPTGLVPGSYTGTVTISAAGASNSPQTINVGLTVAANPLVIPSPNVVTFSYQVGGAVPASQMLALTSTTPGTPTNFASAFTPTAGGPNFLTIAPTTGATPTTLTLTANPAGLAPGSYTGQISIVTTGNGPLLVPVTLTVGNNPLLTFSQPSVNFNFQIGTTPPVAQTISVGSTGAALNFTQTSTTTSGGNFFTVTSGGATPGTTPGTLTITPNPAGLPVGNYAGTITVTPAGSTPQTLPVTLTVSGTPLININPSALSFTASLAGGNPPAFQTLALTSTSDPLTFTAAFSTTTGGPWLVVTPTTGSTPANISVGVNPAGLAIGTYSGSVVITGGGQTQTIPVTLVVNSGITISVTPAALSFIQLAGGTAPATQAITVASTNGSLPIMAMVTAGSTFLTVTSTAATPGTVTVSANAGALAPGTYNGSITITGTGAANGPQVVPVTLTVTAPGPALTATPTPINISAVSGGVNPPSTTIAITAAGGAVVPFTVTAVAALGGTWLTATPASGATPSNVLIAYNIAGLAVGTYTGTVTVTPAAGAPAGTPVLTIPVNLTVTASPLPLVAIVQSAASAVSGAVAPGEIVSIFGTNIGPVTPVALQLTATGAVATTLGNTQVTFDGIPAPLTYVSTTQINAVVPYEIAGRVSTHVVVTVSGRASIGTDLRVVDSAPAIFTINSMGSGPGAILNQDYNVNTVGTPAAVGTVIQIFATGEGQDNPASITGSVNTSDLKRSALPVSVTIGGQPAQVTYAGSAPGFVAGVLQVNAIVPAGVQTSPANVVITVGSGITAPQSQANVTVNVQTSNP